MDQERIDKVTPGAVKRLYFFALLHTTSMATVIHLQHKCLFFYHIHVLHMSFFVFLLVFVSDSVLNLYTSLQWDIGVFTVTKYLFNYLICLCLHCNKIQVLVNLWMIIDVILHPPWAKICSQLILKKGKSHSSGYVFANCWFSRLQPVSSPSVALYPHRLHVGPLPSPPFPSLDPQSCILENLNSD